MINSVMLLKKYNLEIIGYLLGLESLEARIVVHQKNEAVYEEYIAFLKYNVKVRDNSITELKNQLAEALREKDDLKLKLEMFKTSSMKLTKLINSQISISNKFGVGFKSQINENELHDCHLNKSEVFKSASDSSVNELEDPSKQRRKISQIDEDEGITLVQMKDYTAKSDISTANVPVSTAGAEVSTASPEVKIAAKSLVYIRTSAAKRKNKGKAIMKEAKPVQKNTKLQLEQERLGLEEALRLQEQLDEEERQRIARVHEEANTFNAEEWDNIQAQIKADEELAH
ncbi:hypothetical protein Tco_1581295, partial [Tanacetum coccineum]